MTPFILSQIKNGYPVKNVNIGANKDTLLMNVPANHWSELLKPQHYGFHFLDTERGFSFYWNFKYVLIMISSFLLFMLLTKNNYFLSVLGSLWILCSGFVQWWFSANVPETIGFSFLAVIGLIYMLFSRKLVSQLIGLFVFIVASFNFVLLFYPAFQVPIGYLCLAIFIGFVLQDATWKRFNKTSAILLLVSTGIIMALLTLYYLEVKETIQVIMSTVYPGLRASTGGNSLELLGRGYFEVLLRESNLPVKLGNMSEASSFVLLFPPVILAVFFRLIQRVKQNKLIISLVILLSLFLGWLVVGFPLFVSRITLLSMTTANRLVFAVGLASIMLVIIFMSEKGEQRKWVSSVTWILSTIIIGHIGWAYVSITSFSSPALATVILGIVIAALIGSIAYKRPYIFATLLLLLIIPNLRVNPVIVGLGPIVDTRIATNKNDLWLSYGDLLGPAYLKAQGFTVLNGVNYTPNFFMWSVLDPTNTDNNIYNRYSHIVFTDNPKGDTKITLLQSDAIEVRLNPCDEKIRKLGVNRVASTAELGASACLTKISENTVDGLWLYSIKD